MFGRKKIMLLEAQVEESKSELEKLGRMEASEYASLLDDLKVRKNNADDALNEILQETREKKNELVEIDDQRILQDVGIYQIKHPLANATAYKERLKEVTQLRKAELSRLIKSGGETTWTVGDSKVEGRKMVKQTQRLMLEAYNSALENSVRTMKPYTLDRAIDRMEKVEDRANKNGEVLGIRISDEYHRIGILELELTADYLVKKEEEKEDLRAEREIERENKQAQKEFDAEKKRLQKQRELNLKALAALSKDRVEERGQLEKVISSIEGDIEEVESRAANTRTGFVYVISNVGSFGPDIIKVGLTRRLDPTLRVRELGDASVPFKFDVHALIFSHDAVTLERDLHERLKEFRVNAVNQRREFFYATPDQVREIIEEFGTEYLLEYDVDAEAYEWHESGGPGRRISIQDDRIERQAQDEGQHSDLNATSVREIMDLVEADEH